MEGGYVNEAIINPHANPVQVPNPLSATTAKTKFCLSPPQSQASPSTLQLTPEMNSNKNHQTPHTTESSTSSSTTGTETETETTTATATTVTLMTTNEIEASPNSTSRTFGAVALNDFVQRMRNIDFQRIKNIKKRVNFRNFSKDKFLGGQLKTKNGQKYVFNGKPTGMLVSKTCVLFTALIILLALISSVIITYFITANTFAEKSCASNGHNVQNLNATHVATASMLGMPQSNSMNDDTVTSSSTTKPNWDPKIHNEKYFLDAAAAVLEGAGVPFPNKADGDSTPIEENNPKLQNATKHLIDAATAILEGSPVHVHIPPAVPVLPIATTQTATVSTTEVAVLEQDSKTLDRKLVLHEGWSPLHYKLIVEPNLATSTNNGSVLIEVQRDSNISSLEPIVLDVHNISISNVRVLRAAETKTGSNEALKNIDDEEELDFDSEYGDNNATFVITLNTALASEHNLHLILSLDFVSELTDTLQGIYKTSYTNFKTSQKEWMVSTQFSPIDARRAFPCFDRPDKKANFTISIIRESEKAMSLSNMPLYRSLPYRPGYTKDEFQTTPKMPTYLVAFIVSNLVTSHYSELDPKLLPKVEVWTRAENVDMTNYAYSMVRRFLPFYENYFGVKNRLPKIDLVSVPDFGFSAMENWGLITFRDSALLVPEDVARASSSVHLEHVAITIAHELAHQWFGNLITPKWWDDLWLKEGFACFMSYNALNSAHPEFLIMDTFTVFEFQAAMSHDVDKSSHAISFDVNTSNDIRRIFDPITYSKGTILLRMLNAIVGEAAFREAIQDLLKNFAYQNIHRDDVWNAMTTRAHGRNTLHSELNVKDIMDAWITKPGYPVVNVQRVGQNIKITQTRYMLTAQDKKDKTKWYVPITYETDDEGTERTTATNWLTPDENELVIEDVFSTPANNETVLFLNLNRQGYYRVNYDNMSWLALKRKFATLPRITRAQILDDSLYLAQAEYLTYDIPLTFLTEIYTSPDDELLWRAAQQGIIYLIHMFQREPGYETFRAFMKSMVRPAFDKYGLNEPDNESHLQLQHRAIIAQMACKFNYDRCTVLAHEKYRHWMADPKLNPIKPNLKPTIYCTALAEGSYQEWYFAYKQYKRTTSASEKEQILTSLGCTTKPWLLSKYLNLTINPTSSIQKQDGARAFRAVAENPIGYEIAFEFLQTNIKEISEYFGDGFLTLSEMISAITTYMNKELHKQQLLQFAARAKKLGIVSVEKAIELAMERVNNNIYWRDRSYYQLKGFLEGIVSDLQINIF